MHLPSALCCLRSYPAGVEVLRKLGKQLSPLRSLYTAFRACYPWTAAQLERFVEVRHWLVLPPVQLPLSPALRLGQGAGGLPRLVDMWLPSGGELCCGGAHRPRVVLGPELQPPAASLRALPGPPPF